MLVLKKSAKLPPYVFIVVNSYDDRVDVVCRDRLLKQVEVELFVHANKLADGDLCAVSLDAQP